MKQTLLELTQGILSSISGDEVDSINDTVESTQVANILKDAFFDLVTKVDLDEHNNLFNLTSTSDFSPTMLERPDNVETLLWFKYNKRLTPFDGEFPVGEMPVGDSRDLTSNIDVWDYVNYLPPHEFLDLVSGFDQESPYTGSFNYNGNSYSTTIYYRTDKGPDYWTSFDDKFLVCDSYDQYVDEFLRTNKTNCFGKLSPTWIHEDTFIPDLDTQQFVLLRNEAKAIAWAELKQASNTKAEKKVRDGFIQMERDRKGLPAKDKVWDRTLPNYGRRP
jgi:hypothetical protein